MLVYVDVKLLFVAEYRGAGVAFSSMSMRP